jgi:hypothetical protein
MASQLMDPLITRHDIVFLLVILAFVKSCFVGITDDPIQIVLLECAKNPEEELSLRVVSGTLVFVGQISSHNRISNGFCI